MIEITILSAGTLLLLALGFTGVTVVAYLTYRWANIEPVFAGAIDGLSGGSCA